MGDRGIHNSSSAETSKPLTENSGIVPGSSAFVSQSDVSAFEDNPNIINSNKNTQTNSNPSFKPTLNQYTSSRHFTTVEAWTINNFTSDNTTTECKKRNTEVVIVEKPGNFTNTQDFHLSGNIILINNNNNKIKLSS